MDNFLGGPRVPPRGRTHRCAPTFIRSFLNATRYEMVRGTHPSRVRSTHHFIPSRVQKGTNKCRGAPVCAPSWGDTRPPQKIVHRLLNGIITNPSEKVSSPHAGNSAGKSSKY